MSHLDTILLRLMAHAVHRAPLTLCATASYRSVENPNTITRLIKPGICFE